MPAPAFYANRDGRCKKCGKFLKEGSPIGFMDGVKKDGTPGAFPIHLHCPDEPAPSLPSLAALSSAQSGGSSTGGPLPAAGRGSSSGWGHAKHTIRFQTGKAEHVIEWESVVSILPDASPSARALIESEEAHAIKERLGDFRREILRDEGMPITPGVLHAGIEDLTVEERKQLEVEAGVRK